MGLTKTCLYYADTRCSKSLAHGEGNQTLLQSIYRKCTCYSTVHGTDPFSACASAFRAGEVAPLLLPYRHIAL